MDNERRKFLKTSVGAGAVAATAVIAARSAVAAENDSGSNGVVIGNSPKKEILYKKNANWDMYYKAAY